jgi:hypothetical protein
MMTKKRNLKRVAYAASAMDVSISQLRALIREGVIHGFRFGRFVMVDMNELESLIVPIVPVNHGADTAPQRSRVAMGRLIRRQKVSE